MIFSYAFENNIKVVLPELFLCSSIIGLLFFGSFVSLSRNYRYPLIAANTGYLLVLALLFTLLLVVHNPLVSSSVFNGVFVVDWLSTIAKISILASSIFSTLKLIICLYAQLVFFLITSQRTFRPRFES